MSILKNKSLKLLLMNKKLLTCAKIFLFLLCILLVERFCHKQTKGFSIGKITSHLSFNPDWSTLDEPFKDKKMIENALDQTFTFFGSGGQCYAFLSDDKTTVLKFFKHHHMRPYTFLNRIHLPLSFDHLRNKFLNRQKKKLEDVFGSCKIAYEDLKEETGLIYLHLNPTKDLNKKLKLVDKLGIAHCIEADTTTFVMQKKAELAFEKILKQIKSGDSEEVQQSIHSLMQNILKRCKKGIKDKDTGLKRNFGFLRKDAIAIDVGSFVKDAN